MSPVVTPRVRIPDDEWTAFRNEIMEVWFRRLKEKSAAAVFTVLYDLAYHNRDSYVKGSFSDLSEWTGLDTRTVKKCLRELRQLKLIRKSKSRKRTWKVPLANVDLGDGNWTAVPRLLIQHYIPVYHKAVLLLSILRIHCLKWKNYCWARTETLGKKMGWGETRTRYAMTEMSSVEKWKAKRTRRDLPHPLSWWKSEKSGYWQYRVRAVRYERRTKKSKPTVRLSSHFSKAFDIPILK
ncbi:MAG TPA: helix-turn-helix domain-containing protein [Candidatus Binatia bacterium]|nr:helix-turn-helix domain-containing protein [Candidatus Binatia bacterium]